MKKQFRLARRSDFQRLLGGRRLFSSPSLLGFAASGRADHSRLGVTTSRQIRGAVARNRARRRLLEAARLVLFKEGSIAARPGISLDIVLIARPPALEVSFASLQGEVDRFSARLPGGG